jgi:hypothetical protein
LDTYEPWSWVLRLENNNIQQTKVHTPVISTVNPSLKPQKWLQVQQKLIVCPQHQSEWIFLEYHNSPSQTTACKWTHCAILKTAVSLSKYE